MNLREETISAIKRAGQTPDSIVFVGSADGEYACSWPEFLELANRDYDAGFGAQEVAFDLVIAFSDGMVMRRHEYDGSEGWDWATPVKAATTPKRIRSLFVTDAQVGWESLDAINTELEVRP